MGILAFLEITSGYLAAFASNIMASMGSACAQALQEAVPAFELNLSRYVVQTLLSAVLMIVSRHNARLERHQLNPMLLAGVFSNVFNLSYYTASAILPLGTQLVFTSLFQILASTILNRVVLKKSIQWQKFIFMAIVIVGLLFVLQPSSSSDGSGQIRRTPVRNFITAYPPFVTSYTAEMTNDTDNQQVAAPHAPPESDRSIGKQILGYVLCVVAAFSSTGRATVYRVSLPTVPMSVLGFWVGILGVIPSVAFMFFSEQPTIALAPIQFLILFGHSFGAASYSTFNIYAQQKLSPVTWALMDNSKIVINFVLQYTVLAGINPGHENVLEIVGAVIALIGIGGLPIFEILSGNRDPATDLNPPIEERERILPLRELMAPKRIVKKQNSTK